MRTQTQPTLAVQTTARRNYENLTDEELVNLVREGDNEAFSAVYKKYEKIMACYVRSNDLIKKAEPCYRVEDIVSEVMRSLFLDIQKGNYENKGRLKNWLLTSTRNLCINLWRRNQNRVTFSVHDMDYEEAPTVSPCTGVQISESYHFLMEYAKNSMTEKENLIIEMLASGYKYHEMAEATGLLEGTVKSKIFHIRKKLEEFLADNAISVKDLYAY